MTSQWKSFVNYRVGDQVQNGSSVIYGCILVNTNEPPPNPTYWNVITPVGTGLTSLQALTSADNGGNLVLASPTATFTTTPSTGTIDMTIAYPIVPDAPTTSYASFYSNTTQVLASGAETLLTYDAKSIGSADITIGVFPSSLITVVNGGIYKFLFSIQVDRTGLLTGDFQAWIRVNGTDVPESNTQVIVNQNIQTLSTCEFIVDIGAGQTIEVVCWSNSANNQALAVPISPTTPVAIPSIIANIYKLAPPPTPP